MKAVLEHTIERRLLFHEADPAGIAQFHQLFAWMQEAEQSFFRSFGLPVRDYWASGGKKQLGWARHHAALDFLRPILVDEKVAVRLRLLQMTERTLNFEVIIEDGSEVKARGKLRTICIQGREDHFKVVPIPKIIRDKIERGR
ncbi:MAG: acyl-CoA thioesterase [Deltaproteobacteria bacterium]|nr:acyl-CoA thioesterase [Deltaproteobacteria bacterium]